MSVTRSFRDLFQSFLKRSLSKKEKDLFIFTPDLELLQSPTAKNGEEFLEQLEKKFKNKLTSKQYLLGTRTKTKPLKFSELNSKLKKSPVTFVIFPGFMSEFIETRTFEEVFRKSKKSTFYKECDAKAYPQMERDFHISSLDDSRGETQFRALLFNTPRVSLETIGDIRENAKDFKKRLERFSLAMGSAPENLVFLGYSRGAMVALDLLAFAHQEKASWLSQVKGMVTLGGVIWGSELADLTEKEGTPNAKEIALLKKLKNELKPTLDFHTLQRGSQTLSEYLWGFIRKKYKISERDQECFG